MARNDRLSIPPDHTPSAWTAREAEIARIAARQHGQLTREQLLVAGLSHGGIGHRVRTRRLFRVHRGVYSLGRLPTSRKERDMAAVLACGQRAALSYAAAAAHLGLRASAATVIDVTTPAGAGRGLEGIRAHRSRLHPREVVVVDSIPTTTCSRTLLDLAEVLSRDALAKALDRAEILRLFDLADLRRVIARSPGRRGLPNLEALLSSLDPQTKRTRSELERRFLNLVAEAALPVPEVNATLHLEGRIVEVDFLWRDRRLAVELDGWETHGTRRAFERDRARDQLLQRARYRVLRFTWRQIESEPGLVTATLRAALAA